MLILRNKCELKSDFFPIYLCIYSQIVVQNGCYDAAPVTVQRSGHFGVSPLSAVAANVNTEPTQLFWGPETSFSF